MIEQLKTIRSDLSNLMHLGAVQRVIDTITQLEAMVGEQEPVADINVRPSESGGTIASVFSHKLPVGSWLLYRAAPVAQQYEAGDVASAAAQGFRDGQAASFSAGDMASQAADAFRAAQQAQAEAEDFSELPDPVAHYGVEDRGAIERLGKKAQAEAAVPGYVLVPLDVLEAASESLGSFVSDNGWTDLDMQAMDNLDAILAQQKGASHE